MSVLSIRRKARAMAKEIRAEAAKFHRIEV